MLNVQIPDDIREFIFLGAKLVFNLYYSKKIFNLLTVWADLDIFSDLDICCLDILVIISITSPISATSLKIQN